MKAIGYMRLSFKDQSRYSLDAQESAIKTYCTKYDLELVALFKDNGQRSSTFDRLDFKALEVFIKRQKGLIRYLIVMEHDRFSRDLSEALLKIKNFELAYGIKVVSVDEALDIDPSDPTVFISRAFRYATANAELLNIQARTKRGIKRAQLEGRFINKAPFGYNNNRDFLEKSILVINKDEAEIIRHIFTYYLSGISMVNITNKVRQMGFPLKGHNVVGRLLDNHLYAGLIKINNEDGSIKYIKGLHESIVTEADFWLVQEIKSSKRPSKIKLSKDFLLKGLLKCECGKYMTAGFSKGRRQHYLYYCCANHRSVNIPGKKVHEQFEKILSHLKLTTAQLGILKDKIGIGLKKSLEHEYQQVAARQKMLRELDNKIDSIEEHLINKHIDTAIFKKWSVRYNIEHKHLWDHIRTAEKYIADRLNFMENFISSICSIHDIIYNRYQPLTRQMILKSIFRYGLFYKNSTLNTYKICPALSHNNPELIKEGLIGIDITQVNFSTEENEHFLNFITEQMLDILSDSLKDVFFKKTTDNQYINH